jgi:phosphoribosylformylglycinamidine cyclo-ligase
MARAKTRGKELLSHRLSRWRAAGNVRRMSQKAYAAAGVDIDLGNRVKASLPQLLASTRRREVLGTVGGFGGLFALNARKFRQPVLVASTDGVGTKLKIAFAMNRHDTVGQDLVNHCVNDIAVLGAEPLFFLDYIGTGRLRPRVFAELLRGFATACQENHCALLGGETAQMPGFYQEGEYDLSGTIVGVVEKAAILDGKSVRAGDAIIGLASSGLHTNGYSLARRIFFERMKLTPRSRAAGLAGSIGDELLKVHRSYGPVIQAALRKFRGRVDIKALAHITGGGFIDNVPRALPEKCDALIRKGSWEVPPVFQLIAQEGGVGEEELYEVFNMGIGMTMIVAADKADAALRFIRARRQAAWIIGEVARGTGRAIIV